MSKYSHETLKVSKKEEVNYKKNFCEKYFDKGTWDLDVLKEVDVLLKDKISGRVLLYIETKFSIENETQHRHALAQVILTNKKQDSILNKVALVYQDADRNDILELIDCSDNSVMYNNDINWKAERASSPSKDAIDRINDRIKDKITTFENEEIKEFYALLKTNQNIVIDITEKNFNVVYNQWKNDVKFKEVISDEQDLINLFLVDVLNNTNYKKKYYNPLLSDEVTVDLIREGTNLSQYQLMFFNGGIVDGIKYSGSRVSNYYTILDKDKYTFFWKKYRRPPEEKEFMKILEHSGELYSDKYRRDTGGEYTPICFVEKQNKILSENYNLDEFIIFDPCAGVGNLENQFGKDYKQYCYLSTLEQMDVDICKIKGFENAVKFDYLLNNEQPQFKHRGTQLDIAEIAKRENRKLMVIMNPPYQKVKGKANNLAIEFFNKVLQLKPQVIVFYYETKSFFGAEIEHYINSGYKIKSHIFSNAKTTFQLSEWQISQIIFDRDDGAEISRETVRAERYELKKDEFLPVPYIYIYDFKKPSLFAELKTAIKNNAKGLILGNVSYLNDVIKIGNGGKNRGNNVTTENLTYCLLSKGLIFNTNHHYFELNSVVYRGRITDIPQELFNDAIMFSLFYIGILFSNKEQHNYIMPFTAEELGCGKNDLNVLYPEMNGQQFSLFNPEPFDFRKYLAGFEFSQEAKELYKAALQVFRYYHGNNEYQNKDWNDSFYDITNTIMGKDVSSFKEFEPKDSKGIYYTKTIKGTKGFGKKNIKYAVNSKDLPIFENFFEVRDILAQKINDEAVKHGILLWKRENIY